MLRLNRAAVRQQDGARVCDPQRVREAPLRPGLRRGRPGAIEQDESGLMFEPAAARRAVGTKKGRTVKSAPGKPLNAHLARLRGFEQDAILVAKEPLRARIRFVAANRG